MMLLLLLLTYPAEHSPSAESELVKRGSLPADGIRNTRWHRGDAFLSRGEGVLATRWLRDEG